MHWYLNVEKQEAQSDDICQFSFVLYYLKVIIFRISNNRKQNIEIKYMLKGKKNYQ